MRTKDEGLKALRAVDPKFIGEVQKQAMLRLQVAVEEFAYAVYDNVPDSADRTAAMRKLLECKFTCVQAITHEEKPVETKKEPAKNVGNQATKKVS